MFAESIPSLGAGLLFGSILGYGAFLSSQNEQNYGVILGSSAALGGLMGYRFYNTGKIMPAGMIAAVRYVLHQPIEITFAKRLKLISN